MCERGSVNWIVLSGVLLLLVSLWCESAEARMKLRESDGRGQNYPMATARPAHMLAAHRIGRIELAVTNNGTFGVEYTPASRSDYFTGDPVSLSCQYPKGSGVTYLFGAAFWIGAVAGRDTLVSVGADGWQTVNEMFPDDEPFGQMQYRSIKDPNGPYADEAVSEEDYISVYTDTFPGLVDNDFFGRLHKPLNIEVREASYAWSYAYAEDFVLFDYRIRNIGSQPLHKVYMGIYVDDEICYDCMGGTSGYTDDHSGFLRTYANQYGACQFEDTVFIAWQADNDGDADVVYSDGRTHPTPDAVATRIVRTPAETLDVSFNWWIGNGDPQLDFGPRELPFKGQWAEPFRDFGTGGLGTPEGDVNKYYILRNREFDYDQIFTADISPNDTLWLYPNQDLAADFADGYDTRYLLSFGPFEIVPGQSLPISFAYLAGQNIHRDPANGANLPDRPDLYYRNLDFTDLSLNAMWASWVYDNPGVDSDGDGYFGKHHLCSTLTQQGALKVDTFWYEGDGIPDFRGAAPPPPPDFRLESPSEGTIVIRFNGLRSETTRDNFSRLQDFEGYRVYLGRDNREESFSLIASYDRENFNKYVWNEATDDWELNDPPFTLPELRCLYADSCGDNSFDPLFYTRSRRFQHPDFADSQFFFVRQDFNAVGTGAGAIEKTYPDQPFPSHLDPDSARPDELTPLGHLKYFEYQYTAENLLPTVPYWVNVTAFDFGSPESGLASLETSVTDGAKSIYTILGNPAQGDPGKITVYPNPYRADAGYRDLGFEGRQDVVRPDNRVRAVHFANLPPKCTIRIFTLDGDLVREIVHDGVQGSSSASHDEWDLITRNTQRVATGLYYWTVEDAAGNVQTGRLAIIM